VQFTNFVRKEVIANICESDSKVIRKRLLAEAVTWFTIEESVDSFQDFAMVGDQRSIEAFISINYC